MSTPSTRRRFLQAATAATALAGFQAIPARVARAQGRSLSLALHIGLNVLDSGFYGDAPRLQGCVNDANDMARRADAAGFSRVKTLHDDEATFDEAHRYVGWAARNLVDEGDTFLLTFSSHGAQLTDESGDEEDGQDEAYCLYDRPLLDDDFYEWFRHFKPGVRVIAIIDMCHSGSASRAIELQRQLTGVPPERQLQLPNMLDWKSDPASTRELTFRLAESHEAQARGFGARGIPGLPFRQSLTMIRALPTDQAKRISSRHGRELRRDTRSTRSRTRSEATTRAAAVMFSACQDNELALDGDGNGLFTWAFKTAYDAQKARSYQDLFEDIDDELRQINATQHPRRTPFGDERESELLEQELPFTV
jgi:metacaspase-1